MLDAIRTFPVIIIIIYIRNNIGNGNKILIVLYVSILLRNCCHIGYTIHCHSKQHSKYQHVSNFYCRLSCLCKLVSIVKSKMLQRSSENELESTRASRYWMRMWPCGWSLDQKLCIYVIVLDLRWMRSSYRKYFRWPFADRACACEHLYSTWSIYSSIRFSLTLMENTLSFRFLAIFAIGKA